MAIEDVNRISPGEQYEEFNNENFQEVQARLIRMETALERQIDQWNAPSLLETLSKTEYKVQFGNFNYSLYIFPFFSWPLTADC